MRRSLALAALLFVAAGTTIAGADTLRGDPRVCALGAAAPCANSAAGATLRAYMTRREGRSGVSWNAVISCRQSGASLLAWACTFRNAAEQGTAAVRFRATSSGWRRAVTVRLA